MLRASCQPMNGPSAPSILLCDTELLVVRYVAPCHMIRSSLSYGTQLQPSCRTIRTSLSYDTDLTVVRYGPHCRTVRCRMLARMLACGTYWNGTPDMQLYTSYVMEFPVVWYGAPCRTIRTSLSYNTDLTVVQYGPHCRTIRSSLSYTTELSAHLQHVDCTRSDGNYVQLVLFLLLCSSDLFQDCSFRWSTHGC